MKKWFGSFQILCGVGAVLAVAAGTPAGAQLPDVNAALAVDDFKKSNRPGVWPNLDKTRVLNGLQARWITPAAVNQEQTGFCGPAAIVYELAHRQPSRYIKMCQELFENGRFFARTKWITSSQQLRNSAVPAGMAQADWMLMASIREASNSFWNVDARRAAGEKTSTLEVKEWTDELLGYSDVRWTTTIVSGELEALQAAGVVVRNGGVAFLHISADLLQGGAAGWFPDHYVALVSGPTIANGRVKFTVQSWGRLYPVDVATNVLEDYLWGTITGTLKLDGEWEWAPGNGYTYRVQIAYHPSNKAIWYATVYYPNTSLKAIWMSGLIWQGKVTYSYAVYDAKGNPQGTGIGDFTTANSHTLIGWTGTAQGATGVWSFTRKR